MICSEEARTSVRLLVLGVIWLRIKQVRTNSQPQSRWSAAPACFFVVKGGKKRRSSDVCARRQVKKAEIISRGRYWVEKKPSLIVNSLHMRPGAIAVVRTAMKNYMKSQSRHCCIAAVARTTERLSRHFRRTGISSRHFTLKQR